MWSEYSIFDIRQKALIVAVVSIAATFSGFASNIYFPAITTVAESLNVSIEQANLSITCYLIFQGLAPSLWGPISDVRGRRVGYICTFIVFLGACIGLALTKNYATLIVLRCLQSTGSASTIAIGGGVIGDITTRAERGGYMGIFQAGLLTPVAVGPIIGGALADAWGWRSIFWFLTIYGGVFLVALVLLLPETLRSLVADGSKVPKGLLAAWPLKFYQRKTRSGWEREQPPDIDAAAATPAAATPTPRKSIDFLGPLRNLVNPLTSPIIFFIAIHYAIWQMGITIMSSLFHTNYNLSESQIGLTYIANGAGCILGTLITGKLLDRKYQGIKKAWRGAEEDLPLEKARLTYLPIFSIVQSAAILLFGWTLAYPQQVTIALPIIATFCLGWTAIASASAAQTYLVDLVPGQSAAATASLNLARCLLAAGSTSLVEPLVSKIGIGPTMSIAAGVQVLALAGLLVHLYYVARRRHRRAQEGEENKTKS